MKELLKKLQKVQSELKSKKNKYNLLKKLQKVQSELKSKKNKYNAFGKYNYRSCEDILEDVKPLLFENDLSIIMLDDIEFNNGRYYIKSTVRLYDLASNTSDFLEVHAYAREEESKKGMDASQITGASSSYARKYALNGLFAIDDAKDSDATNKHGNYKEKDKQHINEDKKREYLEKMKNVNSLEELKKVWSDYIPQEYRLELASEKNILKEKLDKEAKSK